MVSTKEVDRLSFEKQQGMFVQLQSGIFQEESLFFCLVAFHKMTTVLCV